MALVTTYGARGANSYLTVAEANSIIATGCIFFDEWEMANTQQREAALVMAANDIESKLWHGSKFYFFQYLSFPRVPPGGQFPYSGMQRSEPGADFTTLVEQDEYISRQKTRVQQAQALQALYRLRGGGRSPHREDQFRGVRTSGRGIKFSESFSYGEPDMTLCPEAWDLLRYYKGQRRLVRGDAGTMRYTG